jgi:HK97 family phage prohead protease
MNGLQTRAVNLGVQVRIEDEDPKYGFIEGHAAIWDKKYPVWGMQESIVRGAFTKTLKETASRPVLWSHDRYEPIGIDQDVREDDKGLYVVGRLSKDVQRARETLTLAADGVVTGLSIGFLPVKYEEDTAKAEVRHTEVRFLEWSPVVFPASPGARVKKVRDEMGADYPEAIIHTLIGMGCDSSVRFDRALLMQAQDAIQALIERAEPVQPTTPLTDEPPKDDNALNEDAFIRDFLATISTYGTGVDQHA